MVRQLRGLMINESSAALCYTKERSVTTNMICHHVCHEELLKFPQLSRSQSPMLSLQLGHFLDHLSLKAFVSRQGLQSAGCPQHGRIPALIAPVTHLLIRFKPKQLLRTCVVHPNCRLSMMLDDFSRSFNNQIKNKKKGQLQLAGVTCQVNCVSNRWSLILSRDQ